MQTDTSGWAFISLFRRYVTTSGIWKLTELLSEQIRATRETNSQCLHHCGVFCSCVFEEYISSYKDLNCSAFSVLVDIYHDFVFWGSSQVADFVLVEVEGPL